MTVRKPSPGTLIALLALFVALGGPAQAAKLISGKRIKKNSITTSRIRNHTLTSKDIAKKTVSSLKRKSSSVSSAQIVDGSVSLADMAFGSVTGNQVVDRSLSAVDLGAGSIGANELATSSVGNAQLGADSVTNNKIATGAVSKGSIRPAAVGTEEVIDHALTGQDIARASGTATATGVTAPVDGCVDLPSVSGSGLAGSVVLASAPVAGVHIDGRATNAGIALQACNDTNAPIIVTGSVPYLAIAP